jgi:hypothetical protein
MGCRRVRPADFRGDIEGFITMEPVQDCVESPCLSCLSDPRVARHCLLAPSGSVTCACVGLYGAPAAGSYSASGHW